MNGIENFLPLQQYKLEASFNIFTQEKLTFPVKTSEIWIVITLFRFICYQTKFPSPTDQSKKYNYKTYFIRFNKKKKSIFLCEYDHII